MRRRKNRKKNEDKNESEMQRQKELGWERNSLKKRLG